MQLFLFLFSLQHMKRPALQNKQVGVLRMAFRARKVLGTFEKRAPETPVVQRPGWINHHARDNSINFHSTCLLNSDLLVDSALHPLNN